MTKCLHSSRIKGLNLSQSCHILGHRCCWFVTFMLLNSRNSWSTSNSGALEIGWVAPLRALVHPMVEHSPSYHTVLLIEPDRDLARITRRALQVHGFVVTQVAAGEEALAVLSNQYPDAVVLDPDLTDGVGSMLLDHLHQLEQREGPSPVWIVISALDLRDVVRRYGPFIPHFLAKPFDPWHLVGLLEELL